MTEICTIPELKILIKQAEEAIKEKKSSLHYHETLLKDLRGRLDAVIVDGLRLGTRKLLEANDRVHLKWKWLYGSKRMGATLEQYDGIEPCGTSMWSFLKIPTEDEIQFILRNRAALRVDCQDYFEYMREGEIDASQDKIQ